MATVSLAQPLSLPKSTTLPAEACSVALPSFSDASSLAGSMTRSGSGSGWSRDCTSAGGGADATDPSSATGSACGSDARSGSAASADGPL